MAKKKQTKTSLGKVVLNIMAIVISLLTSLALFLNTWTWKITNPNTDKESLTNVGGYFEDMEPYEKLFNIGKDKLPSWASTLSGILVISAVVCAVVFTFCSILKMLKKSNKTISLISKASCFIMFLLGIGTLITSLIFVLAKYEGIVAIYSMVMDFGAVVGFVCPIIGGVLGIASQK